MFRAFFPFFLLLLFFCAALIRHFAMSRQNRANSVAEVLSAIWCGFEGSWKKKEFTGYIYAAMAVHIK
jgi:hypothetical protein